MGSRTRTMSAQRVVEHSYCFSSDQPELGVEFDQSVSCGGTKADEIAGCAAGMPILRQGLKRSPKYVSTIDG